MILLLEIVPQALLLIYYNKPAPRGLQRLLGGFP